MNAAQAPIWGNFVGHGDEDLLAFAWLFQGCLLLQSYYHAGQAMEKYLKGLALSIEDPGGTAHPYPTHKRWLTDHNLARLGQRCAAKFPYYGTIAVQSTLQRFSEFDQATRYPWVERKLGNGFTTADVPVMVNLLHRLRNDVPLVLDDYVLGMLVRGHHQFNPQIPVNIHMAQMYAPAFAAARTLFPNIETMVRR
jgi:hypothetical protein